jgi:hypothetical protein
LYLQLLERHFLSFLVLLQIILQPFKFLIIKLRATYHHFFFAAAFLGSTGSAFFAVSLYSIAFFLPLISSFLASISFYLSNRSISTPLSRRTISFEGSNCQIPLFSTPGTYSIFYTAI